jgi:hypothetical protein
VVGLRHVLLASGHDIPLRLLPQGTLPAGVTLYGRWGCSHKDRHCWSVCVLFFHHECCSEVLA